MSKSKRISSLSYELDNIDKSIEVIRKLDVLPFAALRVFNGSNEAHEITISESLRKPLKQLMLDVCDKDKQEVYYKINKELKTKEL